jgi:MFS family permease
LTSQQAIDIDLNLKENQPHYRRNFGAFLSDYVFFALSMAFFSQNTVMPAFFRQLTDSPLLIGLSGTVQTVGWLLPQLFAANYLSDKPKKKKYLLTSAAIGRPVFFLLALALVLGLARYPAVTLTTSLLFLLIFRVTDALGAVAWFDILGRVFPANRRGRLFGLGQVLSGLLSIGAGLLINAILGDRGPPFPHNYALIFLTAGLLLTISWLAEFLIEEPEKAPPPSDETPTPFMQRVGHIWREDRHFRLFIGVRLLFGLSNLAIPFYVVFATDRLGLGEGTVGTFTSAQVVGSIAGAVILGALYERQGGRRAVQAGIGAAVFSPLWALLLSLLLPPDHPWQVAGYSLVFVALGIVQSAFMQGFFNYLLDLAPPDERGTYVALSNAIVGLVLSPVAFVGGAILKATHNSYATLFIVTAVGVGLSFLGTLRTIEPRSNGPDKTLPAAR